MAVAVNATGTSATASASGTTFSFAKLTIAAGPNLALLVYVGFGGTPTSLSITWGGTALTQIKTITNTNTVQLWGLINPATGTQTLAGSWTGSMANTVDAMAFNGVEQSFTAAFINATSASATSTAPALTVTSDVNNYAAGAMITGASSVSSPNQTLLFNQAGPPSGIGQYAVGASSVAFSATTTSAVWGYVGCAISAAICRSLPMVGVGCGIWAAKKIEENPTFARRRLILPATRRT